jgi:hypothetical protein
LLNAAEPACGVLTVYCSMEPQEPACMLFDRANACLLSADTDLRVCSCLCCCSAVPRKHINCTLHMLHTYAGSSTSCAMVDM